MRSGRELTTASTNRSISGFSSVKPPATFNVTASSIWTQLKENHIQRKKEENKES